MRRLVKEEVDVQIRLFDDSEEKIVTHYFCSRFVYRRNAAALVEQMLDTMKDVPLSAMAMLAI